MTYITNYATKPDGSAKFIGQYAVPVDASLPLNTPLVVRLSLDRTTESGTLRYNCMDKASGVITDQSKTVTLTVTPTALRPITLNAVEGTWNLTNVCVCTKTAWDTIVSTLPDQTFSGDTMPLT
ncbi:hypothetical protein [Bifidobacterium biavatii]|uniref:Uncharacterized protein n=1 Tax=Bifidobacterium biavatii DSM 23969 TaxID=1437608 RepID=A0A086ZDU1_9BIFI|nr:hypothetical protein [Bifidobacterium biavatii]KFI44691.1 hypothetical protein BBIA_2547 [Bifidobacterium biavatii DSM 23969]